MIFCILSGEITLGLNIHIGSYSALYGSMGIELENNTGISPVHFLVQWMILEGIL